MTIAEKLNQLSIPEPNSGCLLWTGTVTRDGYGIVWIKDHSRRAHRAAWIEENGPIPDDLWVLQKCDVRSCINVDHLFLGTNADNMADKMKKGRGNFPRMRGEAHGRAKLTLAQVQHIRESGMRVREICARYGVSKSTASRTKSGVSWRSV